MPSPTRQDVMAEIERQFTGSERTTALKTLNLFTGKPGEREQAQLAILAQSGGSLETLRTLVDSAKRSPGDGPDARVAQATAIAQLQGARHVPGQDAVAPVGSSKEYPPYRYIFYVAIGIIPVLTLGGAIPVAIAAGGISACRQIATDARQPHLNRLLLCFGITIACWAALFALVGGVAFLRSRG